MGQPQREPRRRANKPFTANGIKRRKIAELIRQGMPQAEITVKIPCSTVTVVKVRKAILRGEAFLPITEVFP